MIFSNTLRKCPSSHHYGPKLHLDKLPSSIHWTWSSHTPHSWAPESPAPRWRVSSRWLPIIFLCSFSQGPEPNWRVKPNQWKILWSNLGVKNIVSFELLSLCCRDLSSAWTGPGEQGENRRHFGLIVRFEYVETFFQDSTYIIVHN